MSGTLVPFENFKTSRLVHDEYQIEIAETRKESYVKDSRKPIVESTTLEEDLLRRDFTINAIAMSLNDINFGEIIDPLGGIKDLNKGILITPLDPDETFSDDPLRMLRAVRFAAKLDFQIASNILDSISRMSKRLDIISWERITEEILKCLKTDKPKSMNQLRFKVKVQYKDTKDNLPNKYQGLNFVQYEVGYDENGVSLSKLPGRLPPPNHEFGPVKLTIFK